MFKNKIMADSLIEDVDALLISVCDGIKQIDANHNDKKEQVFYAKIVNGRLRLYIGTTKNTNKETYYISELKRQLFIFLLGKSYYPSTKNYVAKILQKIMFDLDNGEN